jgi:hypothetical protein
MKEHFTLRYSATEDGDSLMELDLSFDNPTEELLLKRIQDWLIAIGKTNVLVSAITAPAVSVTAPAVSVPAVTAPAITVNKEKDFYDVD